MQLQTKLDRRARRQARGRRPRAVGAARARMPAGRAVADRPLRARRGRQHRPLRGHDGADRREPRRATGGRRQADRPRSTSRVDFDALLREALPPRADPLAPALANALQQAIRSRLDAFVASDEFQQLWVEANRRAHARVVALLTTGESGRLRLEGDTVYLDLGPAVDRVTERPRAARAGAARRCDPGERRRPRHAAAVGGLRQGAQGDRPDRDAGDRPADPRAAVPGRARALSRPRRRGLLRVGLGLIVTALLMLAVVGIGRTLYLDAIDRGRATARGGGRHLRRADRPAAHRRAGGGDRGRRARAARARARPHRGPDAAHEHAVRGLATDQRVGWVAEHRGALQIGAVVIGGLVLLSWDPPTAGVVLIDAAAGDRGGGADRRDRGAQSGPRARRRSPCSAGVFDARAVGAWICIPASRSCSRATRRGAGCCRSTSAASPARS